MVDTISRGDLEIEQIGSERLVLVARPDHPLAGQERVRADQLAGETLLPSRIDCSYRRDLEKILSQGEIRGNKTVELNSVAAVKACVGKALGITIVPSMAVAV